MKIIVGLGNPGQKYSKTRHNVGFMVVERLGDRLKIDCKKERFQCLVGKGTLNTESVLLVKPQTYMNLSGLAVKKIVERYNYRLESLMVVCDDLNLPIGKLRIRRKGSSGGHKGLESISQHLATSGFPRMRIGIGSSVPGEASDYVLDRFLKDESKIVEEAVDRACEALSEWVIHGIEKCMNKFN